MAVAQTYDDATSLVKDIYKDRFIDKFMKPFQHYTKHHILDDLLQRLGISITPIDFYTGESVHDTNTKPLLIPMGTAKVQHHLDNPTPTTENRHGNSTRDPADQFCCSLSEYMFFLAMDRNHDILTDNTQWHSNE